MFRAVRSHEAALAAEQSLASFGGDPAQLPAIEERFRLASDDGELWGLDADGALIGHCRLSRVDHYFGGRAVPCMEVAGVAVPELHRRRGVATQLMEGAIAWGAHQDLGLTLLFPGATALYRRLGWEQSGVFPRYRLDTPLAAPPAEPMRPASDADWPGIQACSDRYVATLSGAARRGPRRWETLRSSEGRYVLDGGSGIEAYALVYRGADPSEGLRSPASVDWAATTPRGVRAVAGLLAEQALGPVTLHAPLPFFWSTWSDSWAIPEVGGLYWMARGLHLSRAIEERGFPRGLEASVTFSVLDRFVFESQGPWCLQVAGGRGGLHRASTADVLLDARAVGPLFTGFRSPSELALAGLLDGPPQALEILQAMFAGPIPVALDFF